MSDRADQSDHATRAQAVYASVTDVLDTVASFDGRFSFTPVDPDGHGLLSFSARDQRLDLAVEVTYDAQADHVRVTLAQDHAVAPSGAAPVGTPASAYDSAAHDASTAHDPDTAATSIVAYEGSRSVTAIHYQLGAALAKWYGEAVRSQFGPTVGENEG